MANSVCSRVDTFQTHHQTAQLVVAEFAESYLRVFHNNDKSNCHPGIQCSSLCHKPMLTTTQILSSPLLRILGRPHPRFVSGDVSSSSTNVEAGHHSRIFLLDKIARDFSLGHTTATQYRRYCSA
jgi:hypothetical protein